jgi:hypothetical protein
MSHNYINVSSKVPNNLGEIVLNVDDISSVTTPTNKQLLAYDGANWTARTAEGIEYEETLHTEPVTSATTNSTTILLNYPTSPARFYRFSNYSTQGDVFINAIHNSDIDMLEENFGGGTIWFYGFRFLTAGVYRITAKLVVGPNSSDSSFVELQLSNADNSVTYGPRFQIGNANVKQKNILGVVNASVNDEVGFYKHSIINAPKYYVGDSNILVIIERLS